MRLKGITGQGIQRVARTIKAQGEGLTMFDLDTFAQAYVEAMLWSSSTMEDDAEMFGEEFAENLDDLVGFIDMSPEAVAQVKEDCDQFQEENAELLDQVSEEFGVGDDQHGHDFWLTRAGHGAGFWDRGYGDLGERLSDAARKFGHIDPYIGDDKKVYF